MPAMRALILTCVALLMAACAPQMTLDPVPEPLGDFSLGYNIVVVDNPQIGPFSRTATDAEWKASLEHAIGQRFSRFTGSGEYHVAIKVQAYALAQPGIPLVATPKSVLLITANVWRPTGKINPEPKELTIWEGLSENNAIVGSGLGQTREQQMARLSFNAALKIEDWFRENPDWFRPGGPVVPGTDPKQPAADVAAAPPPAN
jgi:hypothetical protein